jgi:hypothetical protein
MIHHKIGIMVIHGTHKVLNMKKEALRSSYLPTAVRFPGRSEDQNTLGRGTTYLFWTFATSFQSAHYEDHELLIPVCRLVTLRSAERTHMLMSRNYVKKSFSSQPEPRNCISTLEWIKCRKSPSVLRLLSIDRIQSA